MPIAHAFYKHVFVITGLFSAHLWAQKDANVLPKGIYRVRVVNVMGNSMDQKLNAQGKSVGLSSALQQSISAQAMAAQNSSLNQLYTSLEDYQTGLGDSLFQVDLLSNTQVDFSQTITAAEYGINSKLSLGIIVPYVRYDISSSFGANVYNNVADVSQRVQGMPGLEPGVQQFAASMPTVDTFSQAIFADNGYVVPNGVTEISGLGDIELGAKYQFYSGKILRSAVTTGFRLPTASYKAQMNNILDKSTGDEQADFALESANDFILNKNLSLGVAARYTWQLPSQKEMALLRNGETGLPNLNEKDRIRDVRRDLGDYLETELSAQGSLMGGAWKPYALYGYSVKASDSYDTPSGFQSENLEKDSGYSQHRYEVGLGFSTIPLFVAKKFFLPGELKLAYNSILAGTNTARNSYARLDLIVYF